MKVDGCIMKWITSKSNSEGSQRFLIDGSDILRIGTGDLNYNKYGSHTIDMNSN